MQLFRIFVLAATGAFCLAAHAQWQWVDNAGRKVFSDQPPPFDIPAKNILKQPRKAAALAAPAAPGAPAAAAPAGASAASAASLAASAAAPPLSKDDKELLAKKKKAESETAARVKEEADKQARNKATNCENAKANQALLDSGVRIAVTNAKGEREYFDDAARATEQRRVRAAMDANCR
jgi:hypothetical protein